MASMTETTPASAPASAPIAARKPHSASHHGRTLSDDYAWLRDPGYPEVKDTEVLAHLEAENRWFEAHMAPHQPLLDRLYEELKGRIKEEDRSVPAREGDWLYWREFAEGAQYRTWWRRPADAPEGSGHECILDEPALAEGHDYFRLGAFAVSPDGRTLAYSTDTDGSERFTVHLRDLASGDLLPDTIPSTLSSLAWTADSRGLLYGLANAQWRTDNARLHWVGSDPAEDIELFREADEGFRVDVGVTQSERFLVITTGDHETSEVRLLPADNPLAEPILVAARRKGVEYAVEDHGETLFIHTNDSHPNFRLATAPLADPGKWTGLIEGSDRFYMTDVTTFADFYVVEGREDGLDQIEVRYYDDPARVERIAFPEASYDAGLSENPEWCTGTLRLGYESMVTPGTVYDYDVKARSLTVRKVQEVPSGYEASLYATTRLMVTARDGTAVPVSLVWKRAGEAEGALPQDRPLHLYGYGAYGIAIPPGFSTNRLSLLDRGFVYAIAHIRGGDDLGRHWYQSGKLTQRTNTFHDFIDIAEALVDRGVTRPGRISIAGGSAGGELVGAAINMAPQLWGAAVAHVPFVDVLNTMLDASLPLTPGEWPEWGNPIEDVAAYDLIASYSPYDQVSAQAYPPLMVTAGLNDPRVTYWEPAKWVAKLRATRTNDATLILKTNMGAGHGGKSGRFESLKEDAEEMAFILTELGVE
ncbi:S9 family peptidase [Sphingomonas lacunae]|nr:S9 family peptidase [Sphingomonas lacunae]